jgi:hypothetical protein
MPADQQARRRHGVRRDLAPLPHDQSEPRGASVPHPAPIGRLTGGGTIGNERLTAATGILLIVPLAALGVTIVRIGPLISPHLFIGLMLIPPVALKMASTGYRFARYYTSDPVYRERGAPPMVMRLMGPIMVASTVAVLATGVALLFVGPNSAGTLRGLHKASFIVWIVFMALHMLGHLQDIQKTFLTDRGGHVEYNTLADGRTGRTIALVGALVAGAVLAIVLIPHFGAWSHFEAFRHHH